MSEQVIEIEKNVPIPKMGARRGGGSLYPLYDMLVGDSFLVPKEDKFRARTRAHAVGKITGFKFTSRTIGNGIRIWRVE